MDESVRSVLFGLSGLYLVAVVAIALTLARSVKPEHSARLNGLVQLLLIGIACQCFHFVEEFVTGFYAVFPRFLGLAAWTPEFFVCFNLSWIGIWLIAAVGVQKDYRIAFFPVWFFALGMLVNLVGHPLLALANGAYFPGLITSPVVGILGYLLWRRLFELTERERRENRRTDEV